MPGMHVKETMLSPSFLHRVFDTKLVTELALRGVAGEKVQCSAEAHLSPLL